MGDSTCAEDAAANLQRLLLTGRYSWCNVRDDLATLLLWFDDSRSWAEYRWFDALSWSPRINTGPFIIFSTQQLLFMAVSLLANAYIIVYHFTNAPHPKFCMSLFKRVCLVIHILSGSIGVLLPLFVFFTSDQVAARACMFLCAGLDFVFAASAYLQAPSVYGVRCITVPLYYVCVGCKVALNTALLQSLLYEPLGGYKAQVEWLWMCWVIHQTYAWVRIWYMTFFLTDAVLDHQYTASVFLAGSMCVGAALGFYLWIVWVASMAGNYALIRWQVRRVERQHKCRDERLRRLSTKKALTPEESRDMQGVRELGLLWEEAQANCWRNSPEAAEVAYAQLEEMLVKEGLAGMLGARERPDFRHIDRATPNHIKARLLFDFIDQERVSGLTVDALSHFLIGFGVGADDAARFFAAKDVSASRKIDFVAFEQGFGAFYTYAFSGLLDWIDLSTGRSYKNFLAEIVAKERAVKCPFSRFSVAARPAAYTRLSEHEASKLLSATRSDDSYVSEAAALVRSLTSTEERGSFKEEVPFMEDATTMVCKRRHSFVDL